MCPLFLMERSFISENAISTNNKHIDLCQYSLTVSEGVLFQSICCLYDCGRFFSTPNSFVKLAASAYTDWFVTLFSCFFVDMNYLISFLKPKLVLAVPLHKYSKIYPSNFDSCYTRQKTQSCN